MPVTRPSIVDRAPRFAADGAQLGSIRQRAVGALIDACLFIPLFIVSFLTRTTHIEQRAGLNGTVRNVTVTDRRPALIALALALPFAIYVIVAIGHWGRTLGERAMHLRVVAMDGSMPGWSRSVRRWVILGVFTVLEAFVPFGLLAGLPGLVVIGWMLFDEQRQGLHDKFAGVLVVRTQGGVRLPPSPLY